jgi:general secretion pathway protein K
VRDMLPSGRLATAIGAAKASRGAVLLMVLIFGAAASSLAVTAMRSSSAGVRAATVYLDEVRAEELGRAAVDLIAARLASAEPGVRRAGAFAVPFADAVVEVSYIGETARVDLNAAPPELLAALFQAAGASPTEARLYADRIVDWRDPDDTKRPSGAEAEDYARAGLPPPGNRNFVHLAELDQVLGLPAGMRQAIAGAVTVASGKAGVDPTISGRLVVRALSGGEERRADTFIGRRGAGFERREEIVAAFPSSSRTFIDLDPGRAVRATIRVVVRGRFERRFEAVVGSEGGGIDVQVVSWQSYPGP